MTWPWVLVCSWCAYMAGFLTAALLAAASTDD